MISNISMYSFLKYCINIPLQTPPKYKINDSAMDINKQSCIAHVCTVMILTNSFFLSQCAHSVMDHRHSNLIQTINFQPPISSQCLSNLHLFAINSLSFSRESNDGKEKLILMVCLTVRTSITMLDILQGINEIAYVQETKYGEVNLDYVLGIGGFNLER